MVTTVQSGAVSVPRARAQLETAVMRAVTCAKVGVQLASVGTIFLWTLLSEARQRQIPLLTLEDSER